jgi:hypothetical protein
MSPNEMKRAVADSAPQESKSGSGLYTRRCTATQVRNPWARLTSTWQLDLILQALDPQLIQQHSDYDEAKQVAFGLSEIVIDFALSEGAQLIQGVAGVTKDMELIGNEAQLLRRVRCGRKPGTVRIVS